MGLYRDPSLPPSRGITPLQGVVSLVLSVDVKVKDIALLGRLFPWHKPGPCPRCHCELWWHGFVLAYFSCWPDPIYLRRLRCPGCSAVHRLKPLGYFDRFRSSIEEIKGSIGYRCRHGRWRPGLPRERQRQWWLRLGRMMLMILGVSYCGSHLHAFSLLIKRHIIPVSSAGQRENRSVK